jgi:hypothetical protein
MIVVTPTDKWLKTALNKCSKSFSVSSPYVGAYLREVVSNLDTDVSITLLTRTLLTDFASNASNLDAVCELATRTGGILSLSSLHAKVYVIDYKHALITFANATFSGMYRNRECGFEITRRKDVDLLHKLIESGFGTVPKPQIWTVDDLDELREPVEQLRAALPRVAILREQAIEVPPRIRLQRKRYDRLIESFSGWLRLTIDGISRIPSDIFTMNEVVAACAPLAAAQYPDNRHVREKLRQQMQRLRDLGLVLFLGNGRYERLATAQ